MTAIGGWHLNIIVFYHNTLLQPTISNEERCLKSITISSIGIVECACMTFLWHHWLLMAQFSLHCIHLMFQSFNSSVFNMAMRISPMCNHTRNNQEYWFPPPQRRNSSNLHPPLFPELLNILWNFSNIFKCFRSCPLLCCNVQGFFCFVFFKHKNP